MQPGQQVPDFAVTTIHGTTANYANIWQRKNLVLVALPHEPTAVDDAYVARLAERRAELTSYGTACIVTRDAMAGLPRRAVLIADRWGEIFFVLGGDDGLPSVDEVLECLRFVQVQCPECQGETK